MTRLVIGALLLGVLTLAGCSESNAVKKETPTTALAVNYDADYVDNPQLTSDRTLHKVDEEARSELGLTRIVQAVETQQVQQIGPMKVTFHNLKQLYVEPAYSMIDYFHVLTERENFDLIKTFVTIENTGNKKVHFSPISEAFTSDQKWNWQQEVYLDNLNADYEPGDIKTGNIGFVLDEKSRPTALTIRTSDVFDATKSSIAQGQSLSLSYE
ncbi:hypothetical protein [Kurthia sibirica]|nr:hypothetical protein [Kurthia sibirica]GEK34155.1 hypothetical protein KSI01_16880 [Kurthia sibirica]